MAVPKLRFKEFDGDWFQSKIGEIFQVTSGSTPLRSDNRFFENADIAWVKTTDLNNGLIEKTEEKISQIALKETSVKILPKGTVFVAMYGGFNQIGRTGLLVHEAACNQALSAIYPNEKIDSYFLLTFLNHKVDDWKNFAASSRKDPNITKSDVLAFPLKYPVKEEQTKIASFLSAVDEKISQLTQKHQLLSQYKQGMMQKLFSQQIRFKADDGSEFGEWEDKILKDLFPKIRNGFVGVATPYYVNYGVKYLQGKNIKNGKIDATGLIFINQEFHQKKTNSILKTNDILMVQSGHVGECAVVTEDYDNANCHALLVLSPKSSKLINSKFVVYYFYSEIGKKKIALIKTGNTIEHILASDIKEVALLFPCLAEQTKIANFLSAIDQKIEVVAQQIEQAKTWKKGLLQQMFV